MPNPPPPRRAPGAARRRSVQTAFADGFTVSTLPGLDLPLVVQPRIPGVDLAAWAPSESHLVDSTLEARGALLFRGFELLAEERLPALTDALVGSRLDYLFRSTPRTEVNRGIFTTTEYPADQRIPQHNENAYQSAWPLRLLFFAVQPAERGGETPLADMRRVLARLPADLVARFRDRGVRYVRNSSREVGDGFDLAWTTVFQTDSPAQVEAYCREHGIGFEWRGGDRLRTWQTQPALVEHPATGETVWFNQAHLFHPSNLPEAVRRSLLDLYAEDELPRNATFGDGEPIGEEDLAAIREAIEAETVCFPWHRGDALLLDNVLVSHGRMPYAGPRRMLVAMGRVYDPSAGRPGPAR